MNSRKETRFTSWPFLICSVFCLLYFFISGAWFPKSSLVLEGTAQPGSVVEVQWDSGQGYNDYEKKRFELNNVYRSKASSLLTIHYEGEKHFASLSRNVVCKAVRVDGRAVALRHVDVAGATDAPLAVGAGGVELNEQQRVFRQELAPGFSVQVEMLTNNHSGVVTMTVGKDSKKADLYMANEAASSELYEFWGVDEKNRFRLSLDLPRYAMKTMRIRTVAPAPELSDVSDASDVSGISKISDLSESGLDSTDITVTGAYLEEDDGRKSSVDLLPADSEGEFLADFSQVQKRRFFYPAQFCFQILFAFLTTWIVFAVFNKLRSLGGVRQIVAGKRKLFWLLFGGALCSYSFWLAVFWPGVISVDSLKVWRAALLPEVFINDHPLLNVLLYMYLAEIWNNPAIVAIFQIVCMALLVSYIFYRITAQGVPILYIVPFYLFVIASLPVGLYNITLWKDIPFAMLVVFWGFTLTELWQEKRRTGRLVLGKKRLMALCLLLLALGLIRHNGLVFLVVVPCYFLLLGLLSRKLTIRVTLALAVLAFLLPLLWKHLPIDNAGGFFISHLSDYLNRLSHTSLSEFWKNGFDKYQWMLNVNQTRMNWDLWHYFLGDREAYWFLSHARWNDVFPFVGHPHGLFVHIREYCMKLYWLSYERPWVYLTWNPVYLLVVLPVLVLTAYWTPRSAIFSSFLLSQVVALVFFVGIMNWRYYYFFFVGGLFIFPLIMLDLAKLCASRDPVARQEHIA